MPKVKYDGILFDSDLEVEYYKHLQDEQERGNVRRFFYHPQIPIQINNHNKYTPDFVVFYSSTIEIIETKGYNPYSKLRDDLIHQTMLQKNEQELRDWLNENFEAGYMSAVVNFNSFRVVYKKIKYLKSFGWVDFDFKNPNTLANKRKEKINDLSAELKELKQFKKDTFRYWKLIVQQLKGKKLTKQQDEFMEQYKKILDEELERK